MTGYYDELLRLCGFEDNDINRERHRIDKTFQKLELVPADMERADIFIRENHDISLVGVRKLLRIWISQLIDLVLSKDEGKKIVYFTYPPINRGPGMALKVAAPEKIYSAAPDVILCYTMGQIFNKLNPILEAGEEHGLPPGHALCSLPQIKIGGMVKGIIPIPDLVLSASYGCDIAAKTDELLHERYGHQVVYIDGSMGCSWGEYPEFSQEEVIYFGAQLDKANNTISDALGVKITQETWDEVFKISRVFNNKITRLAELMKADPMPISSVTVWLALNLFAAGTVNGVNDALEAIDILTQEIKQRIAKGYGVVEKGAPRVLIGMNNFSDPRITHMMKKAGIAPIAHAGITPPAHDIRKEKAPPGTYTTQGQLGAEAELRNGKWHSLYADFVIQKELLSGWTPDGVISTYYYNCHIVAEGSHNYKLVEKETGIPHMSLETDLYDTRNYSAEMLRTRVETFAEMLRTKKVHKT